MKKENRIVINRPSPKNEDKYIEAYKKANPLSNKHDKFDIAAVVTKDGEKGHALIN